MAFKQLFVIAACTWSAMGLALHTRAPNPFVTGNLEDLPPACRTDCDTILGQFINVSDTTFSALCTTSSASAFAQCIACVHTAAPEFFTQAVTVEIQTAADALGQACIAIGSPITSIAIPSATGSSVPSGTASAVFSILPIPTTTSAVFSVLPVTSGTSTISTPLSISSTSGSATTNTSSPTSTGSNSEALGRADVVSLGVAGMIGAIGMLLLA